MPYWSGILLCLVVVLRTVTGNAETNSSVESLIKQHDNSSEVDFENKIISLQVVNGSRASLICSVINLGQHQVSWIHVDKQALLSTQDVVRVSNPRIGIKRQNDTFILMIDKTSLDDVGYYACRINSHPPKSQLGFLDVLVPPYFVNTNSESDATVTVKEYSNTELDCKAAANPSPIITWHREDGQAIAVKVPAKEVTGEVLTLDHVSRQATGVYVCVVASGISPAISRRVNVLVQFAPMIRIPSQVVLAGVGQSATMECWTESHPLGRLQWFDPFRRPITESANKTNPKFSLTSEKTYYFSVVYRLTVRRLVISDAGRYSCLIRNDFGAAQSDLTLHVAENAKHVTSGTATPPATAVVSSSSPPLTSQPQMRREQKRKKVATATTGSHHHWPIRQRSTTMMPDTTTIANPAGYEASSSTTFVMTSQAIPVITLLAHLCIMY